MWRLSAITYCAKLRRGAHHQVADAYAIDARADRCDLARELVAGAVLPAVAR
jgi:hypothetical protein